MKVPIAAVRKMKRIFCDSRQMHRMMRLAKVEVERPVVDAMWRGDFSTASLIDTEKFFIMLGYTLHIKTKNE